LTTTAARLTRGALEALAATSEEAVFCRREAMSVLDKCEVRGDKRGGDYDQGGNSEEQRATGGYVGCAEKIAPPVAACSGATV
jgi:hypothetical protein